MAMLELHVLRSGDKGSCAAVRVAGEQEFLCVDCGVSGATFADACSEAGLIPFKVRAFLITHCHSNQVKGLKSTLAWLRKRGVAPAVYVEPGVFAASPALQELQEGAEVLEFHTKQPFWVGDVFVRPFRTFHNNEDKGSCYNFRFETCPRQDGTPDSIVMLSDVGVLSREAQGELPHARLLAIETNYDTELLEAAAQANAQVRFAVDTRGNFSNAQAATVVQAYAWPGLADVVAMYLSRQYNTAERATAALENALEQAGCAARVACSSPDASVSVLPEAPTFSEAEGAESSKGREMQSVCAADDEAVGVSGSDEEALPPVETDGVRVGEICEGQAACVQQDEAATALGLDTGSDGPAQTADAAEPLADVPAVHMEEDDPAGPSAPAAESDVDLPVLEDVFADEHACAQAGFVDMAALVALWEERGLLPADSQADPDKVLAAFVDAGLLDARDVMPSDEGIERGVWACYAAAGDDVCLQPVFFASAASRLWDVVAPFLQG